MSDEWLDDDPFAEHDPAAAERERRRREREARRQERESTPQRQQADEQQPQPADELSRQRAAAPPPKPPRPETATARRRRLGLAAAAIVVLALAAVAAAAAYRHFGREAPPPVVMKTITVTIPEGYSRAQTAELAKEAGLPGDYLKASLHSRYLDPARYGGNGAKNLEGFLFPDTFELERHAPASDLVQLQLEDFKRRIKGIDMSYARSKNLTVYDVVTIASMVEREVQLPRERPLVAAVIYNRLREGIPLGIDATVRFATGNYSEPLTESELAVESPYNTRLNAGLPPGPIGSPGLASIEAAAHPAKVDYLYYVVKPGTCGEHSFSSTEAQFEADVARYNEAREAAGGESPDTCP
jgi:cell division protein YceG involved in septum cleavage